MKLVSHFADAFCDHNSGIVDMGNSEEKKDYVQELVHVLAALRAPGGCPWDREQTHESLKRYLVEETAELLDAIDDRDDESMKDELGDVLLQIIFHCQIASEQGRFDLQEAARCCCEKMVRRHPHVFGDSVAETPGAVVDQWEEIKKNERASRSRMSAVSGVPRHLPALHKAYKIQRKAAKVGFDWHSIHGALAKVEEELAELREALAADDEHAVSEEIGDLLFSIVNVSRFREQQAEQLLHKTVSKFEERFGKMERLLKEGCGKTPEQCTLAELETAWTEAKRLLSKSDVSCRKNRHE